VEFLAYWLLRPAQLDEEQGAEIEAMMQSAAGIILQAAAERHQSIESGLPVVVESMPWDEYLALKAVRKQVAKFNAESQP
jgi:hypothetical protein